MPCYTYVNLTRNKSITREKYVYDWENLFRKRPEWESDILLRYEGWEGCWYVEWFGDSKTRYRKHQAKMVLDAFATKLGCTATDLELEKYAEHMVDAMKWALSEK
jgi:hypothetical protein